MKKIFSSALIAISLSGCGGQEVEEKECDLSKFKLGMCLIGGTSFGSLMSKENTDLSTLIRNGNYTYSTHWEGEKCFIDIHVDGIVKGNSYNTTRKCEVEKYSKDYMQ